MILGEDVRALNRLERNAKRLQKVIDLCTLIGSDNDVLDGIWEQIQWAEKAKRTLENLRKQILS